MCKKSESITEIAKALVKFNGEVKIIEKDAKNPHFKNQYASLDNIIDEIRPILTKHGLSIIQMPGGDGELFTMTTMLVHESGEWIESQPIVMKPVKNDPQGIGSCATYARRYSLAAFLSLNTGEDDDGNAATHTDKPKTQQSYQPPSSGATVNHAPTSQTAASNNALATEGQAKMINIRTKEIGCSFERITDHLGYEVKSGADVKKSDVNKLLEFISSLKEQLSAS